MFSDALSVYATVLFISAVTAQWQIPDVNTPDFDSKLAITQGETAEVQWGFTPDTIPEEYKNIFNSKGETSIWITSFNNVSDDSGYWQCLQPHMDSTYGGRFEWTVNISDEDIEKHNGEFVYRLKPPVQDVDVKFVYMNGEWPSRGFDVKQGATPLSSSVAPDVTPATVTSRVISTDATSTPTNTADAVGANGPDSSNTSAVDAPLRSSDDGGMSTGAIAGIAVGAIALGALALGALAFWLRRRKRSEQISAPAPGVNFQPIPSNDMSQTHPYNGVYGPQKPTYGYGTAGAAVYAKTTSTNSSQNAPAELGDSRPAELA